MKFLVKIAWRNIFRNTRRTLLASLAIGIGLAALIFTDALIAGMTDSMIRTATDTFMGQAQIHADGFRTTQEIDRTVRDLPHVLAGLKAEPHVKSFALRVQTFCMLSSASNVGSVVLYGIDPQAEKNLSRIDDAIVKGAFLDESDGNKILLGAKLAQTLDVGIGDRVVVTAAQAETGELAQDMFRVGGIFHFNSRELDGSLACVPLKRAQKMLGLGDRVHEIAVQFDDIRLAGDRALAFWSHYNQSGNEALGWKDLMPQLEAAIRMSEFSSFIVGAILFAVVSLGIMNTLFMSLYERMFEFGVLRAVGTRPVRMGLMVLFEAGALSIISIMVGLLAGAAVTGYFSVHGIDYVGVEFAGVTFRELIYPVMNVRQFAVFPLWVFFFTLLAGLYPAVYAARITPAKAMRAIA